MTPTAKLFYAIFGVTWAFHVGWCYAGPWLMGFCKEWLKPEPFGIEDPALGKIITDAKKGAVILPSSGACWNNPAVPIPMHVDERLSPNRMEGYRVYSDVEYARCGRPPVSKLCPQLPDGWIREEVKHNVDFRQRQLFVEWKYRRLLVS